MTGLIHLLGDPVIVGFEIAVAAALLITAGAITVRSRTAVKSSDQASATFVYWLEAAMADDPATRALGAARLAALNDSARLSTAERAAIARLLRRDS